MAPDDLAARLDGSVDAALEAFPDVPGTILETDAPGVPPRFRGACVVDLHHRGRPVRRAARVPRRQEAPRDRMPP